MPSLNKSNIGRKRRNTMWPVYAERTESDNNESCCFEGPVHASTAELIWLNIVGNDVNNVCSEKKILNYCVVQK